jgi:hypothetical protein
MPAVYTIVNQRNGHEIDAYETARLEIAVSAVTAAELRRLARAAKAVRAGRPGAIDRLDHVLANAPAPIRDLPARWGRGDKMQLAAIIISLVALLSPLLKDDGAVTPQQLADLVEHVLEQQSSGEQQPPDAETHDSTDDASTGQGPAAVQPDGGKWKRLPEPPDDQAGVKQSGK